MRHRFVLLTIAVTACTPRPIEVGSSRPPPATPTPTSAATAAASANAAIAMQVIAESNRARRAQNVGAISASDGLNRAAMEYAEELAGREVIDHASTTRGKEDVGARATVAGVQWTRIGENLAMFSPRIGIASQTIDGWLNSPGHRHNLLNPLYAITGAGVCRDIKGNYYVVQIYATQ